MRRNVDPIASSHFCYGNLKSIMTENMNPKQSSDRKGWAHAGAVPYKNDVVGWFQECNATS